MSDLNDEGVGGGEQRRSFERESYSRAMSTTTGMHFRRQCHFTSHLPAFLGVYTAPPKSMTFLILPKGTYSSNGSSKNAVEVSKIHTNLLIFS